MTEPEQFSAGRVRFYRVLLVAAVVVGASLVIRAVAEHHWYLLLSVGGPAALAFVLLSPRSQRRQVLGRRP